MGNSDGSSKFFCCFTCYYWYNIHSPNQLFWLVVDLNKDKIPKRRPPEKHLLFWTLPELGVDPLLKLILTLKSEKVAKIVGHGGGGERPPCQN